MTAERDMERDIMRDIGGTPGHPGNRDIGTSARGVYLRYTPGCPVWPPGRPVPGHSMTLVAGHPPDRHAGWKGLRQHAP